MANIFPQWTNWLPVKLIVAFSCLGAAAVVGVSYYFTPKYTRVGYQPKQPVEFSHAIHVNQVGLDCRFCHNGVEVSEHSNVPNTQTCMGCHSKVKPTSPKLAPVVESWKNGTPIPWVRIHKAPDYVYFNHSIHVNSGISCASCHGQVNRMDVVAHDQPHSMGWCLECHRHPERQIRPQEEVFNLDWKAKSPSAQVEMGRKLVKEWNINPPQTCAACHR